MYVSTSISHCVPLPSFVEARSPRFHESQLSSLSSSSIENDTTALSPKQQSSSSYGCRRGLHSNSGRHSIDGRGCGRYTQGNAKSFNSVPQQFTPCPRLPSIPGPHDEEASTLEFLIILVILLPLLMLLLVSLQIFDIVI
ncbi:hypothetical protein HAX54_018461 [Datura stramonium]|uniref:Uncharacterized protein n=1 Tax=Datura stramonium TaxID=4076 RepID=A0ABS8UMA9_DATST|nr:hypothetical protein [Datura stramonium]